MLKGIGILLIVLAGVGGGVAAFLDLNRRAANLETARRLIGWMASRIRYTAAPIQEIAAAAAKEPEFSRLLFLKEAATRMQQGDSPGDAWDKALKGCDSGGLKETDKTLLQNFGRGLGCSDLDGQLAHCESFGAMLDGCVQSAKQEAASKGKLYVTLGVAGGLGAALLLL